MSATMTLPVVASAPLLSMAVASQGRAVDEDRAKSPGTAPAGEFLAFQIGQEQYGVDLLCVQEIRRYQVPTRVASAASAVLGVIDLRGVIVPILDMRSVFNLPAQAPGAFTMTIVLSLGGRPVGVVVDSVSDVIDLKPRDIRPMPGFSGAVDTRYMTGLGVVKQEGGSERMVILLDIERMIVGNDLLPMV
jgi:purine-binding chemotaxis protein CheW